MRVLIVDDEPAVRRSLARALQLSKHEVREAAEGREGVRIWREWRPDLVLLDVLMPEMSGPAVLNEIGAKDPAKIVLMSAYAGDYDLARLSEIGADAFIAKPFADIFEVVKLVESTEKIQRR
jgi:CheY-like chemotaxis protein